MSKPSLKEIREATGITAKRWKDLIPQIQELEVIKEVDEVPVDAVSVGRYAWVFDVEWDEPTIGELRGKRVVWVDGTIINQPMEVPRCYLAPKRDRDGKLYYDFVFVPDHAILEDGEEARNEDYDDVEVHVNDQLLGKTKMAYAPATEWGLSDDYTVTLVQLRVYVDKENELVRSFL